MGVETLVGIQFVAKLSIYKIKFTLLKNFIKINKNVPISLNMSLFALETFILRNKYIEFN